MMAIGKKFTALAFAAALVIGAGSAKADSFNVTVQGVVDSVCEVTNDSIASTTTLDLETTSAQEIGDLTYTCTNPGGFSRSVSSANGGKLQSGSQSINYQVSHTGTGSMAFSATQLASAYTSGHSGSADFAAGQTAKMYITVPSVPSNLLAGTYTDTLTVSITAN